MKQLQFVVFFLVSLSLGSSAAHAFEDAVIDHFRVVTPEKIYRGARPGLDGLTSLARMGVKTDLNLDNDDDVIEEEAGFAQALGIRFVSYALSAFWSPRESRVNAILAVLADPANYPVYVHCLHGQDRTGMVVGLHRVFHDGWTRDAAYDEMLEIGFHPELFLLKHYFDERTEHLSVN